MKNMHIGDAKGVRFLFLNMVIIGIVAFSSVLLVCAQAHADDPLCWNYLSSSSTPSIDGNISTDSAWRKTNQYVFGNGTTQPDATVQMGQSYSKLYLSFQVNHDDHYNIADKIILLFGPDPNDETKDWRIHLHPVSNSGNTGGPPFKIDVWRDSTTWAARAQTPDQTDPTWITARVISVDGPVSSVTPSFGTIDNSYSVEIAFDKASSLAATNGIYYVSGGTMKLHFNVLRVYKVMFNNAEITRVAGQLNWPTNATVQGVPSNPNLSQLFTSPTRTSWGDAIIASSSSTCSGIQVSRHWINDVSNTSVLNPPAPLATSVTNSYYVELTNTGTAPGEKILATIKSERFGIAGVTAFGNIPASPNPLGPSGTISTGATVTLGPAVWTLTSADYLASYGCSTCSKTVCSFVQLDVDPSASSRVLIANRYHAWNTHFSTASIFSHTAVLDTKGFERPSDILGLQHFDLKIFTKDVSQMVRPVSERSSDTTSFENIKQQLREQMIRHELKQLNAEGLFNEGEKFFNLTVCGYRSTGRYILMDGVIMELMENTPCFAYWLHHRGEMSRWLDKIDWDKIIDTPDLRYTITLPHGLSLNLRTHIEAVEPLPPCGCWDFKCHFGRMFN